jgi:hypothetical protein
MAKTKATSKNASDTTLEYVIPTDHDVLLGRGNGIASFTGNQNFRKIIWRFRESYKKAERNGKHSVAREVIEAVRELNPPGRFIERLDEEAYVIVSEQRALEKTCQALRERKMRKPHDFVEDTKKPVASRSRKYNPTKITRKKKVSQVREPTSLHQFSRPNRGVKSVASLRKIYAKKEPLYGRRAKCAKMYTESDDDSDYSEYSDKRDNLSIVTMSTLANNSNDNSAKYFHNPAYFSHSGAPESHGVVQFKRGKQFTIHQDQQRPCYVASPKPNFSATEFAAAIEPNNIDYMFDVLPPHLTAFFSGIYSGNAFTMHDDSQCEKLLPESRSTFRSPQTVQDFQYPTELPRRVHSLFLDDEDDDIGYDESIHLRRETFFESWPAACDSA